MTSENQPDLEDEMIISNPTYEKHSGQRQYIRVSRPKSAKRNISNDITSSNKRKQYTPIAKKNGKDAQRKSKNNFIGVVFEDRDKADSSTSSEYSSSHYEERDGRVVQMKDITYEHANKTARNYQTKSNDNDMTDQSTQITSDLTDQSTSTDSHITDQSSPNIKAKEEEVHRIRNGSPASVKNTVNDLLEAAGAEASNVKEHNRRIEHMKQVCNNREILEERVYKGHSNKLMYISKAYNFSYCKVPKSGCTFWTQIFLILRNFSTADVFGLKRFQVHQYSNYFAIPPNDPKRYTTSMILVSRDPYSRLYSAFIDKVFLSLFPSLCNRIRNQDTSVCSQDVTFEEFLRYIIFRVKENKILNRHWAPIFSLCEPCKVNQYRLVKQESFSKDVEFILKELEIDPIKYKKIVNALHDHRVEITIPGILDTVYKAHLGHTMLARCIGMSGVVRRLWTSFKIQGYIDERIDFPESQFSSEADFHNRTLLVEVILNTIKNNPLTSLESKKQRQFALVSAYKEVSDETIEGIKAIYKPDFVLFGYDTNQPSM